MSLFTEMDLRLTLMALVYLRDTARRTDPQDADVAEADLAAAIVDAETALAALTAIVHVQRTDGEPKVVTDRTVAHTASLALDYAAEVSEGALAGVLRALADRFRALMHEQVAKPLEPGLTPLGYVTALTLLPADFELIGTLCMAQARMFREEGNAEMAAHWRAVAARTARLLGGADPSTEPFHVEEMKVIVQALNDCTADEDLLPRVRATAHKLHTQIEAGAAEARAARSLS